MANTSYIFQLSIGLVLFLAIFPVPSSTEKTNKPTDLFSKNPEKTKDAKGDFNKNCWLHSNFFMNKVW